MIPGVKVFVVSRRCHSWCLQRILSCLERPSDFWPTSWHVPRRPRLMLCCNSWSRPGCRPGARWLLDMGVSHGGTWMVLDGIGWFIVENSSINGWFRLYTLEDWEFQTNGGLSIFYHAEIAEGRRFTLLRLMWFRSNPAIVQWLCWGPPSGHPGAEHGDFLCST